eukprot:TRINITY_DN428_c0_g2_i2.p1 TRINITY_DN428_c0_g2~~TRINITY_DN428_c0_g2_i2.p1  ORF type:complete len:2171 (-),score=432.49 TRINITY_DN428_c0_g2_i2:273-6785(-)
MSRRDSDPPSAVNGLGASLHQDEDLPSPRRSDVPEAPLLDSTPQTPNNDETQKSTAEPIASDAKPTTGKKKRRKKRRQRQLPGRQQMDAGLFLSQMMNDLEDIEETGVQVVSIEEKEKELIEIEFNAPEKKVEVVPKQHVEVDEGNRSYTSRPFSFDGPFIKEGVYIDDAAWTVLCNVPQELPQVEEPSVGLLPVGFNEAMLADRRNRITKVDFKPIMFSTRLNVPLQKPSDIPKEETLVSLDGIRARNPATVAKISIMGLRLKHKQRKALLLELGRFSRTSVLMLKDLSLKSVGALQLKVIRWCELDHNKLSKVSDIVEFCKNSPYIQYMDVRGNPLAENWMAMLAIIYYCNILEVLNGQPVTVANRIEAIEKYGTPNEKQNIAQIHWNLTVGSVPFVKLMRKWDSTQIIQLNLQKMGLKYCNVSGMNRLRILDLSHNLLSSLSGLGLEFCESLEVLSLAHNKINKTESLHVLTYLTSLQRLFLEGNGIQDYRAKVLSFTWSSKGTNKSFGLDELDGMKFSLLEKIECIRKLPDITPETVAHLIWNLGLAHSIGHMQARDLQYVPFYRDLRVCRKYLIFADVSSFVNLQVLDLSQNDLSFVRGLDQLTSLRVINLSCNPKLDMEAVIAQLRKTSTLIHACFSADLGSKEKKSIRGSLLASPTYRRDIIRQLFPHHHALKSVDRQTISLDEYSDAVQYESAYDTTKYRFYAAIVISKTWQENPFQPLWSTDVQPVGDFAPPSFISLNGLCNWKLNDNNCNFGDYKGLTKLNLSHNQITNIFSIGLNLLTRLRTLDLSFNKIENTIAEIAQFIDSLPDLQILAIRNNPFYERGRDGARMMILGQIQKLRDPNCSFRVLDTDVTIEERVAAWKKFGATEHDVETLRFQATIKSRKPHHLADDEVISLDLCMCNLTTELKLASFVNLQVLLLRRNNMESVTHIEGLSQLVKLEMLDLRDNKFQVMSEIQALVWALPRLQSLGISGNPFSEEKKYRKNFLKDLIRSKSDGCFHLQFLDDSRISVEDWVSAWKLSGTKASDLGDFRFYAHVQVKVGAVPFESIRELQLVGLNLTLVVLSIFPNLVKLSLANNDLTGDAWLESGYEHLRMLEVLDISHNSIAHSRYVRDTLEHLPMLKHVILHGNEFYPQENSEYRSRFISKLKILSDVNCTLESINRKRITVDERCEAVLSLKTKEEVDRFRTLFSLRIVEAKDDSQGFSMSKYKLVDLTPFDKYTNLRKLELAHNNIRSLKGLHTLTLLSYLDVQSNPLYSETEFYEVLQNCASLTILFMRNTFDTFPTNDPSSYVGKIGKRLRGVLKIDDQINPHKLNEKQQIALDQLRSAYPARINPNCIYQVDFSNLNIQDGQFMQTLVNLAELPIVILDFRGNPCRELPKFRFAVIDYVKSLEMLDGREVTADERLNALKTWKRSRNKDTKAAIMLGAAGVAVDSKLQGNRGGAGGLSGADDLKMKAEESRLEEMARTAVGSLWTKMEVVVSFFQILGLLISAIPEEVWPSIWIDFTFWTLSFSIDIDIYFNFTLPINWQYVKFGIFMALPPVFILGYHWKPQFEAWKIRYVDDWHKTKRWLKLTYFLLIGAVIGGSVAWNRSTEEGNVVSPGFIGIFAGGITIFFACWLLLILAYRRHHKDENWQHTFRSRLERAYLFMLTILYMPICRSLFWNFRCDGDKLLLYEDTRCPEDITELAPIHYISIVLIPIYVLGIPAFFANLIRDAIMQIDSSDSITSKYAQLTEFQEKSSETPEAKEQYKLKSKEFKKEYAASVRSFRTASSYLYSAYEYRFRYYKIIQMVEKTCLLIITSYLSESSARAVASNVVISIYAAVSIIFSPFSDTAEDVMDQCSRVCNTISMFMGVLLDSGTIEKYTSTVILFIANFSNLIVMLAVLIANPIREWLVDQKLETLKVPLKTSQTSDKKGVKTDTSGAGQDGSALNKSAAKMASIPSGANIVDSGSKGIGVGVNAGGFAAGHSSDKKKAKQTGDQVRFADDMTIEHQSPLSKSTPRHDFEINDLSEQDSEYDGTGSEQSYEDDDYDDEGYDAGILNNHAMHQSSSAFPFLGSLANIHTSQHNMALSDTWDQEGAVERLRAMIYASDNDDDDDDLNPHANNDSSDDSDTGAGVHSAGQSHRIDMDNRNQNHDDDDDFDDYDGGAKRPLSLRMH